MTSNHRAPKQWYLSKVETISSFENWKQNLLYILSLDKNFAQFLSEGVKWPKKTRAQPLRGFQDDGDTVPATMRFTARQKANFPDLMLGQIANYCPILSRNTIVKNSASREFIWQTIREHFGFQVTGAHSLDFADMHLEAHERPEDLYQRLIASVEDSLLRPNGLRHHGEQMTEDEELSPTLENLVVLTWLKLIHPSLPKLVKQRYGTELRSRTLASNKPEISQALSSLLDEMRASDDAKILRTEVSTEYRRSTQGSKGSYKTAPRKPLQYKNCPLCEQAGRSDISHFLSECNCLPEKDRRYIVKARQIVGILEDDSEADDELDTSMPCRDLNSEEHNSGAVAYRVQTWQSPYMDVFHGHHVIRVTIDSGATGNMIRHFTVKRFGSQILSSTQSVHQANGSSQLKVVGETRIFFSRDNRVFSLKELVVENLDVDVLAGTPFMEANDIAVRPAKREVMLGDGTTHTYGSTPPAEANTAACQAFVLRAHTPSKTIWPGEFLEIQLPDDAEPDSEHAIEPRTDSPSAQQLGLSQVWPQPDILSSVERKIRIPKMPSEPRTLKRNEHFCHASPVFKPKEDAPASPSPSLPTPVRSHHSSPVQIDPGNLLPHETRARFQSLRSTKFTTLCLKRLQRCTRTLKRQGEHGPG